MLEIETKVHADHSDVSETLEKVGAEFVTEYEQRDTYFSAPHRDFAETDEALRTRYEDGTEYITYKGSKLDTETKAREEHETTVGDGEVVRSLLGSLGFEEFGQVRKHRRVYELDGVTVTLDDVEGLGEFVEVEVEVEVKDLIDYQSEVTQTEHERARGNLYSVLEKLGLDPENSIRDSYLELLYSS